MDWQRKNLLAGYVVVRIATVVSTLGMARFLGKCLALMRHRSNLTTVIKSSPESMFLSRLPVVIRLLIYEYVCSSVKGYIFITNSAPIKSSSFMF